MIQLIKFKDGKYGIRKRTLFGYKYRDLDSSAVSLWWTKYSMYFRCCKGSIATAGKLFNQDYSLLPDNKEKILKERRV